MRGTLTRPGGTVPSRAAPESPARPAIIGTGRVTCSSGRLNCGGGTVITYAVVVGASVAATADDVVVVRREPGPTRSVVTTVVVTATVGVTVGEANVFGGT